MNSILGRGWCSVNMLGQKIQKYLTQQLQWKGQLELIPNGSFRANLNISRGRKPEYPEKTLTNELDYRSRVD